MTLQVVVTGEQRRPRTMPSSAGARNVQTESNGGLDGRVRIARGHLAGGREDRTLPFRHAHGTRVDSLYRVTLRDTVCRVIVSFRHKGLEQLYRDGSKRGVQTAHVAKLLRILSALDVAQTPADLAIPSFRTHPLKGELTELWSIWVNGNWRVTFRFVENDVELVDYQDYH